MRTAFFLAAALCAGAAHADAVDALKAFVRDARTGRAGFTQTVTSPDGVKKKTSSGSFEFSRPDRFRFAYTKPYEQLIVGDGKKVLLYDADLNQASSRKLADALGATPAALLAGGPVEREFDLQPRPDRDGLAWAEAAPRAKPGVAADSGTTTFQSMRFGFRGSELAAVEIVDAFGQTSLLQFGRLATNLPIPPEPFRFVPPTGADVIEQ